MTLDSEGIWGDKLEPTCKNLPECTAHQKSKKLPNHPRPNQAPKQAASSPKTVLTGEVKSTMVYFFAKKKTFPLQSCKYCYWCRVYYKMKKRQLWDRGFRRNLSLQAVWDTSITRGTGFMWPHQECWSLLRGTKSDSCGTQRVYKYMWLWTCMRPYLHFLFDVIWLTAVWGWINDHALLGKSGKPSLVIGHKILAGNGGNGELPIILRSLLLIRCVGEIEHKI